jgi:hypothetical protein
MFGRPDAAYRRSQAATKLPVEPTSLIRAHAHRVLAAGDEPKARQRAAQQLIDSLNAEVGLPQCEVVVADRPQVHEHDGRRLQSRTYGYYRCWLERGKVSRSRIRIYHRTAVRQQVISPKVFLNTLLHEWTHHFDFAGLKLRRSPHTSGFFQRLRLLAEALDVGFVMPPDPDSAPVPPVSAPLPLPMPDEPVEAGSFSARIGAST